MEQRWLFSAAAALALGVMPAAAEEAAPEAAKPAEPGKQVAPADGTMMAQAAPAAPAAKEEKAPPPKFTYGGGADFYYSTNFNDPFVPFNGLGVFDFKDEHGPHLGLIDLWAQYARNPIGFRLDLMWGPTGRVVNFAEKPISGDDLWDHVQQVYVSANLNKKGTTYIDFGRWVTMHGAEVIEPRDNWLTSRGILFGFAIPFTHFGARVYHYVNDTDYWMASVTRGWDVVSYPAHGIGFGITHSRALNKKWTLTANYMGGNEFDIGGESHFRNLLDLVALYNVNDKWAFSGNVDIGTQGQSRWYGFSTQAKYTLNPRSYLAGRLEWFRDETGFRTGADSAFTTLTLGYQYQWNKYLQSRVEYRHDFATDSVFLDGTGLSSNQPRFLISALVSY